MWTIVNNISNNIFHGLFLYTLICDPCTGRGKRAAVAVGNILIMTACPLLLRFYRPDNAVWTFCTYLFEIFLFLFSFLYLSRRERHLKACFLSSSYFCLWGFFWLVASLSVSYFADSDLFVLFIVRFVTSLILFLTFVLFLKKPVVDLLKTVTSGYTPMLIVSALSFMVLTMYIVIFHESTFSVLYFITFVCQMVLIFCLQYIMFQYLIGLQKQARFRQTELRTRFLREQLDIYRASEREIRQARHDLRHHDRLIASYAVEGDLAGLQSYLAQYTEQRKNTLYAEPICANKLADTVISSFRERAKEQSIDFDVACSVPQNLPIQDTDLVILIANILENALYACVGLSGKPFIRFQMTIRDDKLIIECTNACRSPVRFSDGMPLSKGDRGIGTSSIDDTSKKYGGNTRFAEKNGVFTCTVILPTINAVPKENAD